MNWSTKYASILIVNTKSKYILLFREYFTELTVKLKYFKVLWQKFSWTSPYSRHGDLISDERHRTLKTILNGISNPLHTIFNTSLAIWSRHQSFLDNPGKFALSKHTYAKNVYLSRNSSLGFINFTVRVFACKEFKQQCATKGSIIAFLGLWGGIKVSLWKKRWKLLPTITERCGSITVEEIVCAIGYTRIVLVPSGKWNV